MNEYEMLKAALDFMNYQGLYAEFERYMSHNHDMNDEELREMIDDIKVDNDDY